MRFRPDLLSPAQSLDEHTQKQCNFVESEKEQFTLIRLKSIQHYRCVESIE